MHILKYLQNIFKGFLELDLHEILVLLDVLRIGQAREKKIAQTLLITKLDELMNMSGSQNRKLSGNSG